MFNPEPFFGRERGSQQRPVCAKFCSDKLQKFVEEGIMRELLEPLARSFRGSVIPLSRACLFALATPAYADSAPIHFSPDFSTSSIRLAAETTKPNPVPGPQKQPEPPASAENSPSPWTYSETIDEMRGQKTKHACLESTSELYFSFPYNGGSTAKLCLRKSPKYGNDIIISVHPGQFACYSFDNCLISVKFDDGPIKKFLAVGPEAAFPDLIFVRDYKGFLASLKKANRLIVEAPFFEAGHQQMKFEGASSLQWP